MKKFLVAYENERGEVFEDEIEAESRADAEDMADDTARDMGGCIICVNEIVSKNQKGACSL